MEGLKASDNLDPRYPAHMSSGEDRLATALERALKPPWAVYRNVAWLEKRPGDEAADGEADSPRVGARVSGEAYQGFLKRAEAEGRTPSEVVRSLVEAYVSDRPAERPR